MHTKTTEAGFGSAAIIGIIAVALLGGGVYYVSKGTAPDPALMVEDDMSMEHKDTKMGDGEMMEDEHMDDAMGGDKKEMEKMEDEMMDDDMMKDDVMKKEPISTNVETGVDLSAGSYEAYDASKLAMAANGDVILFFHAPWCPSCRGLDADIEKNLSNIPAGTHILKVDYDLATDLKKKYGVVRQHTLVQVNEAGEKINTLTGLTNTLDQILGQL